MGNIIYSEFIKLKKTFIVLLVLVGGIGIPSMYFISYFDLDYETLRMTTSALDILSNSNFLQMHFLNNILFSIIGAYVFAREHTNKTANILYSYPATRMKIVICKAIVVFILILLVYFLNFTGSIITIGTSLGLEEVKSILPIEFKTCLFSALLQIVIIPLPILIGMVSKNIIIPAIYGVVSSVVCGFMFCTGIYMQLTPFLIPALPFHYFLMCDPIDYIAVGLSGGIFFIGSVAGIVLYLKNCDIN